MQLHINKNTLIIKVVCFRAVSSRLAAGMELADVEAETGIPEESLARMEGQKHGGSIPRLDVLAALADLYCVSIDYLAGRINTPDADPVETNQGAIMRSVSASVTGLQACIEQVAMHAIQQQQEARRSARQIAQGIEELISAYRRVKELNPQWDEEIRGAARLEKAIVSLDEESTSLRVLALETENAERHAGIEIVLASKPKTTLHDLPLWLRAPRAAAPEFEQEATSS